MVQRALDEIGEDVEFLSLAVIRGEVTPRHKEFLDNFYAEEFDDPSDTVGSHRSRGMLKREKIRAYVNQGLGDNASRANLTGKIITKIYSGFIHAASPHIMDMCGGSPPRFDVNGELRNLRGSEHIGDAMNYFLRAPMTMAFAAQAFAEEKLFSEMRALSDTVAANMRARGFA